MSGFINREEELAFLDSAYAETTSQAQFIIIYGKRRVGKTELVTHFFKDKPHLYYLASRGASHDQLRVAAEVVTRHFKEDFFGEGAVPNWRKLFDYLGRKLKESDERLVLVFDEFPYLVESDKAISSYFQYGWDEQLKDTRALLIVLGSSISMMYKHALVYSAPLYGRRTGQWLLEPFTFAQSKKFFRSDNFARIFSFYAIVGGIPAYLEELDVEETVLQNIKRKILTKGKFLYVEPELLLADEFSEPRNYLTILKAIGLGRTKYSELLNSTGFPNNILSSYLRTLINLRLVKREVPVTEYSRAKSKKGIYSLADSFLRFYFSFVFRNLSLIESEAHKELFSKNRGILTRLIAQAYEDSTQEFIRQLWQAKKIPFFPQVGRWWDKNTEIDLVGLNEKENAILFVETKWNKRPLGIGVLDDLKRKAQKVDWGKKGRKEHFALVAKGGFTEGLKKRTKEEGVSLVEEDKVVN